MRHYERRLRSLGGRRSAPASLSVCTAVFRRIGCPPDSLGHSGRAFVAMDRRLDRGATGPLHLRRPEIAELVVAPLYAGERKFHRYELHGYVVMPNPVHLLVTPKVVATRWLGPLKGFTAYRANV